MSNGGANLVTSPDASRRVAQRALVRMSILIALACATPATSGAAESVHGLGIAPGKLQSTLNGHVLHSLDGETLSLSDVHGEVVVLNFWASWCKPCRRELPGLDALNDELAKRGGRVVAVSIDREARNARRFARAFELKLPLYHDGPSGLANKLDLRYLPFTMILDRSGDVVFATGGADEAAVEAIRATARKLLAAGTYGSRITDGDPR